MRVLGLNNKFMNVILATSMVLTTSLQAFSMTESTSNVHFAKKYNERKSRLKSELIDLYEESVDQKIAKIKIKMDKALDEAIAEIDADRKTRRIKKEQYFRTDLVNSYLERHKDDYSKTAIGKVLEQDVNSILNTMSPEEKYVMKLKVSQMLRLKDYGDKYNRKAIMAGALVGFAIGAIISIKTAETGMANSFNNVVASFMVTGITTIVGTFAGTYFNMNVELVEGAEQLQNALVEKADNLLFEADSDLDTLVQNKYYSNLKM